MLLIWPSAILYQLEDKNATTSLVEPYTLIYETPKDLIIRLSQEKGFNVNTSLKIAECESQYGKYKENWSGSGAYGLFQFKPKTFNAYCDGLITSDIDQTYCFIKLYEKHKSWWSCKA